MPLEDWLDDLYTLPVPMRFSETIAIAFFSVAIFAAGRTRRPAYEPRRRSLKSEGRPSGWPGRPLIPGAGEGGPAGHWGSR